MQDVRPESLTDKELFHYADMMLLEGKEVPAVWVREMVRRYFNGDLQVPTRRYQD